MDDLNVSFYRIDTFEDYSKEKEFSAPIFNFTNDIQAIGISYVMNSMTET